ncbi:MAG: hypothetical protein R3304_04110 [Longimicrobiales bacterium]|nr:hypothetical protein [Longimicrobiales bacterium]
MTRDPESSERADLVYAASYAGFVGSAVVALAFLLKDVAMGTPLVTPSILGAALLDGRVVTRGAVVHLELVALASLVHVALFTCVGAAFAFLFQRVEPLRSQPVMLATGLFAALGIGIVSMDALAAPGVIQAIGPASVTVANATAAISMTAFYFSAFSTTVALARPGG